MAKLTRGQKQLAASPRGFDGLTGARTGSLLGSLVARVAPTPKLEPLPKRSLRAAPKHVQQAVKVVEDYVQSLSEPGIPGDRS